MNRSVIPGLKRSGYTRVYMAKYIMGTTLPKGGYTRVRAVYNIGNNDCAETHGEKKYSR